MQRPSILIEDVSLSLDGNAGVVDILKDISIDIQEGESIGIVGPSGSGKSSLLMLMGGLERISNGSIKLLGQNLSEMNDPTFNKTHDQVKQPTASSNPSDSA